MDLPEIRIDFSLFGKSLDLESITNTIGLTPDATWRSGEKIGKSILTHKEDCWCISTGHVETLEVDGLVTKLLDRIYPAHANLQKLYEQIPLTSELAIVIYIRQQTPVFGLSTTQLQQIAALRCGINVDIIQH